MFTLKKCLLFVLVMLVALGFTWGKTATASFHQAVLKGDVGAVKQMLTKTPGMVDVRCEVGRTPLQWAAHKGNAQLVALLLKQGAGVNSKSKKNRRTPLHYAVWRGHTEAARILLKKGADIQAVEVDGESPLAYAAASGNLEAVKMLVEKGAKVKGDVSKIGTSPLSYAVSGNGGNIEMVKYLLSKGADPTVKGRGGYTLLHRAAFSGSGELLRMLIDKGAKVDARNDFNDTPLIGACSRGNLEGALVLMKSGADVNVTGHRGRFPLYSAGAHGKAKLTALLLKAGADVAQTYKANGRTALHHAVLKGYADVTGILLSAGADPKATDLEGNTPLYYASRYGHKAAAKTLIVKGGLKKESLKKMKTNFGPSPYLKKELKPGTALIWYLGHSGWAVKTQNHLMIFDYFKGSRTPDTPLLANGNINPDEIKDLKVMVFSSHDHSDHYVPEIFKWRDTVPGISYVMGFKPEKQEGYAYLPPRTSKTIDGVEITTIKSNDKGVGFFVQTDGVRFYHPGDHANRQKDFSGPFKAEIDYLAASGKKADFMFAPVSGCGFGDIEAVKKGIYYTAKKMSPRAVFPMHAGNNSERYYIFAKEAKKAGMKSPVVCPSNSGDHFAVTGEKVKAFFAHKKSCKASKKSACCNSGA